MLSVKRFSEARQQRSVDYGAKIGRIDPGVALIHKPYRKIELARKIRAVLGTPSGTATQDGSEGCDELRRSS